MIFKELGKTGEKISVIGLGSWDLGERTDDKISAIKTALSLGVNFIDTAEIYGTEPLVGEAIKNENAFIATKVWTNHFHYDDVIKACDGSLQKLGVEQVGLYQLHWPNKSVDIKETMRAMEKLVDDGKVRYIGVSNFDKKQFIEAQNSLSKYDIVSNQVEYSVLVRDPEAELLPYLQKERVTLIAYSPFGKGVLFKPKYKKLTDVLSNIGKKYGKTAAQVALNWLISKDEVVAIPKASTPAHAVDDVQSSDFSLEQADVSAINYLNKKFKRKSLKRKIHPVLHVYNLLKRR